MHTCAYPTISQLVNLIVRPTCVNGKCHIASRQICSPVSQLAPTLSSGNLRGNFSRDLWGRVPRDPSKSSQANYRCLAWGRAKSDWIWPSFVAARGGAIRKRGIARVHEFGSKPIPTMRLIRLSHVTVLCFSNKSGPIPIKPVNRLASQMRVDILLHCWDCKRVRTYLSLI